MGVNDYDVDLYEAIRDCVEAGHLEEKTPAHGIALYVVDFGYEALSPKQKHVYDTVVVPALEAREKDLEQLHMANLLAKED